MIDTHSHIYCDAFDDDRQEVVQRAREAGVNHIVIAGENAQCVPRMQALHDAHPGYISMALGLHPEEVHDDWEQQLALLTPLLDSLPCVAVGEIGIDLYWDKTWREQQMQALDVQLHWCAQRHLPFIIHCREGLDEVLQVMDNLDCPVPPGVFHCFSGNADDVQRIRERGDFYFGVGGTVTYKKSTVPQVLPVIGIDRIVLETDSPYLAPVPHRGKRNESAYVADVNAAIARILDMTPDDVSRITDHNATTLFSL